MTTPRFIDIHVLQPVPLANLNRDDLGSPKTLIYGGTERTRVSSQSWKRAIRHHIEQATGDIAVRTRRLTVELDSRLRARGFEDAQAAEGVRQVLAGLGEVKTEDGGLTSALFFLPPSAFDQLADIVEQHRDQVLAETGKKGKSKPVLPGKDIVEVLKQRNVTINLFGRMLAEVPETEVDGAVQVAHAFTTHATSVEVDFFTAVDDCSPAGERGSAHMNSAQFAAGMFYRYACVAVQDLANNIGGDTAMTAAATEQFLWAFLSAMPTGKRTATAPNTLPELAYVAVRSDRPVSLAGAFEAPVRMAGEGGYGLPSQQALATYAGRLITLWGTKGLIKHVHAGIDPKDLAGLGDRHDSYQSMIDTAVAAAFPGSR